MFFNKWTLGYKVKKEGTKVTFSIILDTPVYGDYVAYSPLNYYRDTIYISYSADETYIPNPNQNTLIIHVNNEFTNDDLYVATKTKENIYNDIICISVAEYSATKFSPYKFFPIKNNKEYYFSLYGPGAKTQLMSNVNVNNEKMYDKYGNPIVMNTGVSSWATYNNAYPTFNTRIWGCTENNKTMRYMWARGVPLNSSNMWKS